MFASCSCCSEFTCSKFPFSFSFFLQIQFEKSYDIFSGSLYRGHFVVRNHLQMDKFTNLVSTDPPTGWTVSKALSSAATFIILLCYFRKDFYEFSMHLEFPLCRFLYDLMTAIKTLERSEVDWILFDLLKSTINWFNVVICIHSILTIVFFCVPVSYDSISKGGQEYIEVFERIGENPC